MMRGRINKAIRGELEIHLPIGYEYDAYGKTRKSSDQGVRTAIDCVFSLFRSIRSIRGILLELRRRNYELPYVKYSPGLGKRIEWRMPTYENIYSIIRNPKYAGIYLYGKRANRYDPVNKKRVVITVGKQDIKINIPNHHEAYITSEEHEENLEILKNNQYANAMSQGATREGAALLQGIVCCGICGLKMRPRYTSNRYYYCCDRNHRRFGDPICGWASSLRIDSAIEDLVLKVLNEGTIEITFQLMSKHKEEKLTLCRQWKQKLKRLEYDVNIARRRYDSVDPENRLVAATLETEWNEKLVCLKKAKDEYVKIYKEEPSDFLSKAQVKKTLQSLPELWLSKKLSVQERKEILRCVIDKVFINTKGKVLKVEILWQGGKITKVNVPKYIYTNNNIYYRIVELSAKKTDGEIAEILNKEGILTIKNKPWTIRRVMDFRLSNAIPSTFTTSSKLRLFNGYVTSREATKYLGVNVSTIQR
jgi:hypothetical protein